MIRHCVFVRFRSEISRDHRGQIYRELAECVDYLDGVQAIHVGVNVSPEVGMDKGFSEGFIVDFDSYADLEAYLADSRHQAVGAKLVEAAVGGLEGILVFDLELEQPVG